MTTAPLFRLLPLPRGDRRYCTWCGYDGQSGDLPEHDLCAAASNPTGRHDYVTETAS